MFAKAAKVLFSVGLLSLGSQSTAIAQDFTGLQTLDVEVFTGRDNLKTMTLDDRTFTIHVYEGPEMGVPGISIYAWHGRGTRPDGPYDQITLNVMEPNGQEFHSGTVAFRETQRPNAANGLSSSTSRLVGTFSPLAESCSQIRHYQPNTEYYCYPRENPEFEGFDRLLARMGEPRNGGGLFSINGSYGPSAILWVSNQWGNMTTRYLGFRVLDWKGTATRGTESRNNMRVVNLESVTVRVYY